MNINRESIWSSKCNTVQFEVMELMRKLISWHVIFYAIVYSRNFHMQSWKRLFHEIN